MNQPDPHTSHAAEEKLIREILETVADPEIPVLSVRDLGIIRKIVVSQDAHTGNQQVEVFITPTYSGCPAMDAISLDIRLKLAEHGYKNVKVNSILSPAWTTDWMTEAGKEKLRAFGIAPPHPTQTACDTQLFGESEAVQCPLCNSFHTNLISRFGSTPCKALYRCQDCKEPFDYFKCH